MENHQHISNFDAMLKQSLEGTQMPVPSGVWEAVGSSIGTKALVATKVASLKLLILKTVAGIVLAGGVGFGVYQLLKPETPNNPIIKSPVITDPSEGAEIIEEKQLAKENSPEDIKILKSDSEPETSFKTYQKPVANTIKDEEVVNTESPVKEVEETKNAEPNQTLETPKKTEPNPVNETKTPAPSKEILKPEAKPVGNSIFLPDAFTPYDQDGLNDCFKIIIENETKYILQIFDNAGQKVFESTDKNKCWDGRDMYTGEMCKPGVYSYKFIYELKNGFKKTEYKGLNLL